MNSVLLARYADSIFWLARFVERAENLARILDVNETFSRDSRGSQNWSSIVQLYADDKRFYEKHPIANIDAVLRFYVTDIDNPTSIVAAVKAARENARTLRPLISTEMWVHLNVFFNRVRAIQKTELIAGNMSRLFAGIKESCQTHTGITEGTFYRDEGWYFYELGRYVERADQTTRLLDIKYHLLLPKDADVGSPIDVSQWSALLRSAAGYHAFRRLHAQGISPLRVAGFLLFNNRFPRSVMSCVNEIDFMLNELRSRFGIRRGYAAAEAIDELRGLMGSVAIDTVIRNGLHDFIDLVQLRLAAITNHLAVDFFGASPIQEQVQEATVTEA